MIPRTTGERVLIKSLDWYKHKKNTFGEVPVRCTFAKEMTIYLGKTAHIREVHLYEKEPGEFCYRIDIDNENFWWSDEMFDDIKKVERLKKLKKLKFK